jgi:hypothetical protein
MKELLITVQDMAGLRGNRRPVTGGVPIAKGAAPVRANLVFALRDDQGNAVPLQTSVLARWEDGSVRWILLDFQSRPPANGKLSYVLSWGEDARPKEPSVAVHQSTRKPLALESGSITVSLAHGALLSISERFDIILSLTDERGQVCDAVAESNAVEVTGKLRSTLLLAGSFGTPAGERVFQFRLRASIYAGLSAIRLEPLILVDAGKGVIQRIRELKLTLRPRNHAQSAQLGGDPGWKGSAASAVRLFQYDDQHYALQGAEGAGDKAPGWAELNDGQGDVAVALRDFWQQWPKSLEASPEGLSIGLFPRFREGDYAHMEPWYKHQYLFDGDCYQLRTGQARRWDIWLDLSGDGESLAKSANAPLVPAADPAQAIAAGVWDAIAPAGIPEMVEYDAWAENLFNAYCHSIEVERDYGAMNWGDWFGERQVNWGNHEYDTTNQILIQFARTGDPRYLYVADAAARHSSEVDTVHHVNDDLAEFFGSSRGYPPRPGMVHQHTIGHVSGFYSADTVRKLFVEKGVGNSDNPYLCLDPFNLGHIWTQGMVRNYFLTGDLFLKETVEKIGKNIAQLVEDREYRFIGHSHCGRTTGWPLLALAGAYEIDLNERYLNAMKTLVEDALAEQDPNCGGWLYSLPRGHCYCEKAKHTGMAGFITAILINGLSRYYFLTGDDRLPDAIDRAVTFLDNDTWREEWQDWRYTSCPATRATGRPGVVMMAHVNAVRIANNPEHLRILRIAWDAKFQSLLKLPPARPGHGKGYSSRMYGCAEAIGLITDKKIREE